MSSFKLGHRIEEEIKGDVDIKLGNNVNEREEVYLLPLRPSTAG
jgi:hypothetical protein